MSTRSVRLALSVLAVAAFAFVAAGCGTSGGDDDAAPTTTEATAGDTGADTSDDAADEPSDDEQAYIDQVNAVCGAGNDELEEIGSTVDENSSPEDLEAFVDDFVGNIQGQLDEIEGIEVPASMSADVDEFLSTARTALDELDAQGAEALMSESDPFGETNDLAIELGFTECGSE